MKKPSKTAYKAMNISRYPEIKPGSRIFKKAYASLMMFIVGRAIEAAASVDKSVKRIFEDLPEKFTFCLGVDPAGPYMVAAKDSKGRLRYLGWRRHGRKINLVLTIKNLESAFRVFTFRESTAAAYSYDRFRVDGNLPQALAVVRVLDIVEVYLLPKIIARLAVKRYPDRNEMPPLKKHVNRIRIYLKAFSPGLLRVIYKNL